MNTPNQPLIIDPSGPQISMPSSNAPSNLDLPPTKSSQNSTRLRKHTPMIMPTRSSFHSSISCDSIPESNAEQEEESFEEDDTKIKLHVISDGTFEFPKLNKVLAAQRPTFESKTIEVNLRHHLFESTPLPIPVEETSVVKLGKCLFDELKPLQKKRKTTSKESLALIKEEGFKVETWMFLDGSMYFIRIICL